MLTLFHYIISKTKAATDTRMPIATCFYIHHTNLCKVKLFS